MSRLSPGQIARKLLGRHFEPVGNLYRRVFVDLAKIVAFFDQNIPKNSSVLDIGGGDGALVERLLRRRPDLSMTMCDLAPDIGGFLHEANRAKVRRLPATDFAKVDGRFDVVTISDVVHHVPCSQRGSFFEALAESCERWDCRMLIVKDIESEGLRAFFARFTDRYITGDRQVEAFSRSDLSELIKRHFPTATTVSAVPDWPNYCEALSW